MQKKRIRQIGIWFVAAAVIWIITAKFFLKIDYDFGQMKNCLLTKYFDSMVIELTGHQDKLDAFLDGKTIAIIGLSTEVVRDMHMH